MIYITGDTHADFRYRFNMEAFPEQKEMTKEDYVIICGDFGGVWSQEESKNEKYWLDWFDSRNYTLLFVDGNHENYDRLYTYPERIWKGGRVHEIRPSVLHLIRGQVFEICGKKIFTFGGARSHDISGGILEPEDPDFSGKKRKLDSGTLPYRINHISWWEQELASEEEMEEGRKNLEKSGNSVDYIISHCCATETQKILAGDLFEPDAETDYLEEIRQKVRFSKWFFGHYHDNRNVSEKEILLYEQIIRIA